MLYTNFMLQVAYVCWLQLLGPSMGLALPGRRKRRSRSARQIFVVHQSYSYHSQYGGLIAAPFKQLELFWV